jgi:hypothetical protein
MLGSDKVCVDLLPLIIIPLHYRPCRVINKIVPIKEPVHVMESDPIRVARQEQTIIAAQLLSLRSVTDG